jgi:hypothetical protein
MTYRFPAAAAFAALALLPLTPCTAQDAQPAPPPPAQQPVDVAAPPPPPAPRAAARAPAVDASAPEQSDAPAPAVPRVRTVRRAPAPVAAPARAIIVPAPAPVPATTTTTTTTAVTPPVAVTTIPPATVPPTTPPTVLNAAPPAGVDTIPPPPSRARQPQLDQRVATWPWFALGALLLAAAAILLLSRRRRSTVVQDIYDEPAPGVSEQIAASPAVVPVIESEPTGVPAIALAMRPIRAGVEEEGARVEFELTVDNRGTAEARDVRVATWMLAAGASEAERALVEPEDSAADTPPLDIPAGEARTVAAQVAMPRSEIPGDAVLPVVVADASYRLPDGSQAHVSARFAVGVPDGEELARFDTEHPSGLHEGVVAQTLGEPEPA